MQTVIPISAKYKLKSPISWYNLVNNKADFKKK